MTKTPIDKVEEALKIIPNRFELTLLLAQKARELKKSGVQDFRTESFEQVIMDGENHGKTTIHHPFKPSRSTKNQKGSKRSK